MFSVTKRTFGRAFIPVDWWYEHRFSGVGLNDQLLAKDTHSF